MEHGDAPPVVVAVDGSDGARAAAVWAADVAVELGADLELLHVNASPGHPRPDWLRRLASEVGRVAGRSCTAVVLDRLDGEVAAALAAHAARARLLVLGSYGRGAHGGVLAGAVARGVIDAARCPVAVVRGPEPGVPPPRGGAVVAGADDSPGGRAALRAAADLAAALGARLVALYAWADVVADGAGFAHRRHETPPVLEIEAARRLDAQLAAVHAVHPALQVERRVVGDGALRALLVQAARARAVVVGRRARHDRDRAPRARGILLGSTSEALVEFAPCPVVVVREEPPAALPAPAVVGSGVHTVDVAEELR
ncbi:universal stress protein [Actinomycetes bacterium KLBMP 9759]